MPRNTLASITSLPVGVSLPSVGGAAALCYSCSISAPDYHQPHCSSGGLEACYFLPRFARCTLCSATICNPVTQQSPYDRLTIRTVCKVNRRYQSVNWRCNSIQLGLKALPKSTDHVWRFQRCVSRARQLKKKRWCSFRLAILQREGTPCSFWWDANKIYLKEQLFPFISFI